MSSAAIQLTDHRTAFAPRDTVTGQVSWQCDTPPQSAELRLVWRTDGRGISDEDIVQAIPFPTPQAIETRSFTLVLPDAPYSFTGRLMTLFWSLEIVIQPGNDSASVGITLAPGGQAISLPRITPD